MARTWQWCGPFVTSVRAGPSGAAATAVLASTAGPGWADEDVPPYALTGSSGELRDKAQKQWIWKIHNARLRTEPARRPNDQGLMLH
jgi:hypothetical protein